MDDLYDNLENYNEENTISELQTENKELKSKLEEYAVAITKLQTDFDKLTSEYKQLELNYSSLLKTAKAEIERKTQIITNLNLEKDRMVLKSFQNRNGLHKSKVRGSPVGHLDHKKEKHGKPKQDEKLKLFEGKRSSPYSAPERRDHDEPLSRDRISNPHTDLRSKLLNLAHKGQHYDSRTEKDGVAVKNIQHHDMETKKNCDAKENIMQREYEEYKARASIRKRRKSMPALRAETEPFSDDEDLPNVDSSINLQRTSSEHNSSEKQKVIDHDFHERPKSRISETSSLEEKKSGKHELVQDSHKHRSSRYDRDKNDKYKVRHKSSHRYKRQSSDRYRSGSKEYRDPRSEHDRHRSNRLESPPRDKFHQRPSRELHRNYERSQHYEYDRLLPKTQERYTTKRRIEHGYELDNKRLKMEPYPRHSEEHRPTEIDNMKKESYSRNPKDDRQIKHDTILVDNKHISDPLEIQFSSCESPDYVHPDVLNQQVKEIKLTATTQLDDPRIFSNKYLLKNSDGQSILTTTIGRNVDIVPVKKTAWGITSVSMPEALIQRPPEPKQFAKDETMDVDNLSNVSLESGEIFDCQSTNKQKQLQNLNKLNTPISETKKLPVMETNCDSGHKEKSLKKINSYKIPKFNKSVANKQGSVDTKHISLLEKSMHDNTDSINQNSGVVIKNSNLDQNQTKPPRRSKDTEEHKQDCSVTQGKYQLSCVGTSDRYEQQYATAKDVVEGDLEMSDDNCDDDEKLEHATKESVMSTELENKTLDKDEVCIVRSITEKPSTDTGEKVVEPCKDKISAGDSKKSRNKKKSKCKVTIDTCKSDELTKVFEKPAKKKDKKKERKSAQIKTKFSELFDDSSSLISPEDLGLAVIPATATQVPDKCVPFFEDAIDAADLNSMKTHTPTIEDSTPPEETNVDGKMHDDITVPEIDKAKNVIQEVSLEKSGDGSCNVQTEMTDDVIKSIYQNLEPGVPEEQDNVIKTVIISTGVQSPVLVEEDHVSLNKPDITVPEIDKANNVIQEDTLEKSGDRSCDVQTEMTSDVIKNIYLNLEPGVPEEQDNVIKTVIISTGVQSPVLVEEDHVSLNKPELERKTMQEVDLPALATSTPYKILPNLVTTDIGTTLLDPGCNSNNNSQLASAEIATTMDKSDSNTIDSQTNETNVPDVRIFVKRRRKVTKK